MDKYQQMEQWENQYRLENPHLENGYNKADILEWLAGKVNQTTINNEPIGTLCNKCRLPFCICKPQTTMSTKTEIDFEKIINAIEPNGELLTTELTKACMQEAMRQSKLIILQAAANKAEVHPKYINLIDKASILNLEHSEELNKKLGII